MMMNPQPISFTGTLTLQDALDLNRYRSLCVLRRAFRWFITVFALLLAATIIFLFVHRHFNLQLLAILFICLYVPFSVWFRRDYQVRRQYRRHPEYFIEHTVTVDENNVSITSANMDLRLAWKNIAVLLDTPCGLMFMLPEMRALCWLPQRLFIGNEYHKTVLGYASLHNIPIRTMK